jgi:hypothetical protein
MFWGSFYGKIKGLYIIWEKDWGIITSVSYREYIVLLIYNLIQQYVQEAGEELILI